MVASPQRESASLADVLPSCLSAVGLPGFVNSLNLDSAQTIFLFVIDGLGAHNLDRAGGHARFLRGLNEKKTLTTVFPSTTASALATLVTGSLPGEHGVTGYRIWNPARQELVNQLSGITTADIESGWLAVPSLIALLAQTEQPVTVVAHPRFAQSPLTELLYGKAPYLGANALTDKMRSVRQLIERDYRGVALVYISDLDETAHRSGVGSTEWMNLIEELDQELARLSRDLPAEVVAYLTADHGVVDVPHTQHREFGLGDEMHGVRTVGGEPRCLQIYLEQHGDLDQAMSRWSGLAGSRDLVMTSEQLAQRYWRGTVGTEVAKRLPDLFVFAPEGAAWYDAREPLAPARSMVGQHGAATVDEREIPFIRLDA